MEKNQSSAFLDLWHQGMLYGALIMFAAGIALFIYHHAKVASIRTPKGKYDFISRREIRNLELVFIIIAIGVAMLVNRYGMDRLDTMGVWFFVRLFISVAGGTLVGYVAFLIL